MKAESEVKMYCKLTNQKMRTHGGFRWEIGKWYRIPNKDRGVKLCSESWFHCYSHPLLAMMLNPIHAGIKEPQLFQVQVKGKKKTDKGLKFGFTMMRLIKEIPVPEINQTQRIAFGILCAKQVYKEKAWNKWADNWLSGKNRDKHITTLCADAADAAVAAVATHTAAAATDATYAATYAAAYAAAYAAYAAAATYAAAYAAAYAAYAATNVCKLNLIGLVKEAMKVR